MSVFDPTTFLETTVKGNLDTNYVLPPEGDYLFQITDKITVRTGRSDKITTNPLGVWASMTLQCEMLDCDTLKANLNLDRIYVNMDLFLDLLPESTEDAPRLDMGVNKNMKLKRLYEATGINRHKQVAPNMLKFTTFCGKLEHETYEDTPMAKITRAASADKLRAAAE